MKKFLQIIAGAFLCVAVGIMLIAMPMAYSIREKEGMFSGKEFSVNDTQFKCIEVLK